MTDQSLSLLQGLRTQLINSQELLAGKCELDEGTDEGEIGW